MEIMPVRPGDAGEVLTLQRAAYVSEAQLYGDPNLPALTETVLQLAEALSAGPAWKAVSGTRMVGAVRTRVEGHVLHIGRLIVAPDLTGKGIGTRLLLEAETCAPPAITMFALFTGHLSEANLRLYARLGYVETRREKATITTTLVHLCKPRG